MGRNGSVRSPTERRKQLRAAGFAPIPVNGKKPPMDKWETKVETNDGEIDIWAKTFPHAKSTGLLTRIMPTLDVDIKNPDAAAAVEALVRERFEDHGVILVRFGNAPKRAIPFRTDTPFKKITVNLIAPDGDQRQKIELLADGQQVVGFGIHEDTNKPYEWFGGEPGVIRRGELPAINQTEAQQLVDDAVELLVLEHGYQRAKDRPKKKQRTNGADDHWDEVAGDNAAGYWAYLTDNIHMGRDLHESIRDLAAKLIRSGMTAGAAVNFLYGLMDLSTTPHDERWQERRGDIPRQVETAEKFIAAAKTEKAQQQSDAISATPYRWIDPTKVPLRQWLYRPYYIRKYLLLTISPGGVGKSSVLITEALSMVSAKALLGVSTDGNERLRVWYWNGEDPADELDHRFAAANKHFKISPEDIGDRLFVDSGRTMPIVLAEQGKHGTKIATPVIEGVTATLLKNKIDVLIVDPFVSCHRVVENDNSAIDLVAKSWSAIAEKANCAVMVAHHTRKPTAGANGGGTVDDGRGATALANAARASRNLNNMTKEECEDARIDEKDRRYYFRMDLGRTNLSPPAERADWFKLVSVDLENNPDLPGPGGDEIGVVTAWEYPSADEVGVSVADIKRVQDAIATGAWRRDQRAKQRWVGIPIAHTFKRDIAIKQDRQWVERHIRLWILSGLLAVEKRPDPNVKNRESVEFVVVGRPPTPADAVEVF